MSIPVSLRLVVDEMDLPNDEWLAYVNRRTGELVTVPDEDSEYDASDLGVGVDPEEEHAFIVRTGDDSRHRLPYRVDLSTGKATTLIEDVLARRSRSLLLDARAAACVAPEVAGNPDLLNNAGANQPLNRAVFL